MKPLLWSAAALTLFLAIVLFSVWMGQRRLMYFPDPDVPPSTAVGLTLVESIEVPADDGGRLQAWFVPAGSGPAPFTVIVFNGNAGNRAYRAPLASALRSRGLDVLLFDYRGFGGSSGSPTQPGLAADARAIRTYALTRRGVTADRLVYLGESLGSAVAAALAAEHPPAALILRSPFTSMVDVAQVHYPVLPVRWLLRDRYMSSDVIARVRAPVLIIAGDRDRIVPFDQSRRLFDLAPDPKQMVVVEGADHNDLALLNGAQMIEAIAGFLRALRGAGS